VSLLVGRWRALARRHLRASRSGRAAAQGNVVSGLDREEICPGCRASRRGGPAARGVRGGAL